MALPRCSTVRLVILCACFCSLFRHVYANLLEHSSSCMLMTLYASQWPALR